MGAKCCTSDFLPTHDDLDLNNPNTVERQHLTIPLSQQEGVSAISDASEFEEDECEPRLRYELEQELKSKELELNDIKKAFALLQAQNEHLRQENQSFVTKTQWNNTSPPNPSPYGHHGHQRQNSSSIGAPQSIQSQTSQPTPLSPSDFDNNIEHQYPSPYHQQQQSMSHGHHRQLSNQHHPPHIHQQYDQYPPLPQLPQHPQHPHHPQQNSSSFPLQSLTPCQADIILGFKASPKRPTFRLSKAMPVFQGSEFKPCLSVSSCGSTKRLIIALKWYSDSDGDNYVELMKRMTDSTYDRDIVADYQHLLDYHLIDEFDEDYDKAQVDKQYELLQIELNKMVPPCDIKTCVGYKQFDEIMKKNLSQSGDYEFDLDFMHLVHCYLMHSKELSTLENEDNNESDVHDQK